MKRYLLLFIISTAGFAQTATIAANSLTFKATINGTAVTIVGPATAVTIPVSGISGLPAGITYTNNVLTVPGGISTGTISLTSGPALPACTSGLFFLAPATSGSSVLEPSCYVPATIPPITVSQAASPINTLTLTP